MESDNSVQESRKGGTELKTEPTNLSERNKARIEIEEERKGKRKGARFLPKGGTVECDIKNRVCRGPISKLPIT